MTPSIVGAGPAGLAAAVYAASEGLSTSWCWIAAAFGGQAGASSRIENYLGFPTGISGLALMARAYNQAQKFGAEIAIPDEVVEPGRQTGDGAASCSTLGNGETGARPQPWCSPAARAIAACDIANLSRLRRHLRALLGLADRRRGFAPARRWRWSARGNSAGQAVVYLAGQVEEGLDDGARPQPGSHHVAISGRPHPRRCPMSRC